VLDEILYRIVQITHYCRDRHISDADTAALNFLSSQVTLNPGRSLDQLFNEARFDEARSALAKQPAMMAAASRLFSDPSYRERIYRQYQEEIVPMLHPEGQK
jgi:hypothetical protein